MKKYLLKRPVEAVEMDFGWLVSFDTLDGRYIARVDFGRGDFHDLFVEVTEETPDEPEMICRYCKAVGADIDPVTCDPIVVAEREND